MTLAPLLLSLVACDPEKPDAGPVPGGDSEDVADTAGTRDTADTGDTADTADTAGAPSPTWNDICPPVEARPCASADAASAWVRLTTDAASGTIPYPDDHQGYTVVGDVDGDGADDVAWAVEGALSMIRGPDFLAGRLDAPLVTCASDVTLHSHPVGDLDGDGLAEVPAGASGDLDRVPIFFGADLAAGVCDPVLVSPNRYGILSFQAVGDVDDDSRDEAWQSTGDGWTLMGWDGGWLVSESATVPPSSLAVDVTGDGVRDMLVGLADDDHFDVYDGVDGTSRGTHAIAPWYGTTLYDVHGGVPFGGADCPRAAMTLDDRALRAWNTAAWTGDGSTLEGWIVAVDPSARLDEVADVGDVDGDGRGDVAWQVRNGGPVCLVPGDGLDGTTWSTEGLRCFDGDFYDVGHGDFDGDGYADLVLSHRVSDLWPNGVIFTIPGGPLDDCDCDDDGTLSAVCGGRDALDDDPTRSAAVREDPENGEDDDGDGLVDETATGTGDLLEGAWILYGEEPGLAPRDGVLLPDTFDPVIALGWDATEGLTWRSRADLGPAREVGLSVGVPWPTDAARVGVWSGGPVLDGGDLLEVWSPPAADGSLTHVATLANAYGTGMDAGGDHDGDGEDDLVALKRGGVVLFDGAAIAGGAAVTTSLDAPHHDSPVGARLADLDGDGLAEVVYAVMEEDAEIETGWVMVAPGGGVAAEDGWTLTTSWLGLLRPTDGDGDGHADIVVRAVDDGEWATGVVRGGTLPNGMTDWTDAVDLVIVDGGWIYGEADGGIAVVPGDAEDQVYVEPLSGTGRLDAAGAGGMELAVDDPSVVDVRREGDTLWVLTRTGRVSVAGFGNATMLLAPVDLP